MISTKTLYGEIQKLATCPEQVIKKTGVGKTRKGRRPIRVATLIKKALVQQVGQGISKGLKALGPKLSFGAGAATAIGGLMAANRLNKEYKGWKLGRQHTLRSE